MILSGWRVLRSLAWYHHVMIVITILVPLGWSVVITLWAPELPPPFGGNPRSRIPDTILVGGVCGGFGTEKGQGQSRELCI